ncbi:MAG: selenide, water dikinase SelD [Clostridia bacterium]|jgi:selenide,water dikinase|nr:selenide, water dikinase SelD [Clostridia bacterium]
MEAVRLTEYSHGAGCGCKIAPAVLETIIKSTRETKSYPLLLVGNSSNDDAAAYDLGNGTSVLSTTDFFMPIVDDPYTFGRIAATNSISDVYAMGGRPLMAISILGWPVEKLSAEIAQQVVEGGRSVCDAAGIPLAGGHSIDSPEPIFGLAVTGLVDNKHLKKNNSAQAGCDIFLTKPLGIGILTTAQKAKLIEPGHIDAAIDAMCTLNTIGAEISALEGVLALTDITGFALLGHLGEVCKGSNVSAEVYFDRIPLLPNVRKYMELECIPGGTYRNFQSFGHTIGEITEEQKMILCDPQTSGGLLAVVRPDTVAEFLATTKKAGLDLQPIGKTVAPQEKLIKVI